MEVSTAKPEQSPKPTPIGSNGTQAEEQDEEIEESAVTFQEAETISWNKDMAGSIPIRAPVSDDIEDNDNESFGTEEENIEEEEGEDEEEDFESASERMTVASDVGSPVGSFTAGNPPFGYSQNTMKRPNEFRNADPLDETFLTGNEVARIAKRREVFAIDDEDVMETFLPLVAKVRDSPTRVENVGVFSKSSAINVRPVAKPSVDDDERPQTDEDEDEDELAEDEYEAYSVAKVPPFGLSGGLRVAGAESDLNAKYVQSGGVGTLQEMGPDYGQPQILGLDMDKFDKTEGYAKALLQTLSPELAYPKFGDNPTMKENPPVTETQYLATAKDGGGLEDSDSKQMGDHSGQLEFVASANEGVLENSDAKQEDIVNAGIVDAPVQEFVGSGKEADDDTLETNTLEFEESGVLATGEQGFGVKQEGIGNEDIADADKAVDGIAPLGYNSKEDGILHQNVIDTGMEGEDSGKSETDSIQVPKEVAGLAVAKEIPLGNFELKHQSINKDELQSKEHGISKEDPESKQVGIDEKDIADIQKVVDDQTLLSSVTQRNGTAEHEVVAGGMEGVSAHKSKTDDIQEAKEGELHASAKKDISEDSNVKQEGDAKDDIDNAQVVGDNSSLDFESEQGAIVGQKAVDSGKGAADSQDSGITGIHDTKEAEVMQTTKEGGASEDTKPVHEEYTAQSSFCSEKNDTSLMDTNFNEDVIAGQVEADDTRDEANALDETNDAKVLGTATDDGPKDSESKQEGIAEEVTIDPVKVVEDSKQEVFAKREVICTRKEADDIQESKANNLGETNVAIANDNAPENSATNSDFKQDEITEQQEFIMSRDQANDTRSETKDMQEMNGGGNQELGQLDSADATAKKDLKFDLDPQECQNVEGFKERAEFSQRQKLGTLESTEDMEFKVTKAYADAGGKMQEDTPQPELSYVALATLKKNDNNLDSKSELSISGDGAEGVKFVVNKEAAASETRPQFRYESSKGNDQFVQKVDSRMIVDWDEEEEEEDDEDEEMVESSALAALMEAASSAGSGSNNASFGAAGFSVSTRPAGLGSSVPFLEPTPRSIQHSRTNGSALSGRSALVENNQYNGDSDDGYEETEEKLQLIRVKFLRLVQRLGQTPQNAVVTQVLYRLGLAEGLKRGRNTNRALNFDRASSIAEEQEAAGQDELDFTCNIMILGKTGVGKSATINSIFDEAKSATDAFQPATNKVQEILGTVHGIKVRIIDTPGLMPSFADQHRNKKVMSSVKKFIRKCPPDIVLYLDRLDMQSRDYSDLPLLRIITETFGAAIWFNAIVVLTHASSAPPEGANGAPLSYEMFVAQRSHIVQHSIRQAAGDMRLMNPVSLVENHPGCRRNRAGQRVLPNGQIWKPQLLLLCFASKVLAEANALLNLQESTPGRLFGFRTRAPPLPFLLSSLLQSRAQMKIPDEQLGEGIESDEDLEELSDSEHEDEYDQLPPFKHLKNSQLSKLTKEQRKAYFDEIHYREKLFQKKQWKEELRRRRNMKKTPEAYKEESEAIDESLDEESASAAAVAVPMPDMAMPPTFDSDNPTYRYRYLDTTSQWLVRPVLETHGWDHDTGYDGVNAEKMVVIGKKIPASISGQITKDKKESNLQLECAASLKHGERKVTLAGFDVQTVGKGLAYTLRGETRFSNFKMNKTTAGLALTFLGDTLATGMKVEDRLMLGKRLKFVVNGGAMMGRGDVAYGGSLEATVRDRDYPIGQTLTTLGLSVMNWHGDLAIGGNLQSQFPVGRKLMMVTRANLNNKGSGQISIRTSSSEQLQIALIGIIPIVRILIGGRLFGDSPST